MARGGRTRLTDLPPSVRAKVAHRTKKNKTGRYKVSPKQERTVDGIVFDSKLEARFYTILKARVPGGELHLQPEFLLQEAFRDPDGKHVRNIAYRADFLLGPRREKHDDPVVPGSVVIDAKGHETDVFKLKRKLFLFRYGVHLHVPKNNKGLEAALADYLGG